MHASKYPVYTVGIGNIMSAGALIFACGAKGHRYIARHTGIMVHQFYSDMEGKEHELESAMKELKYCKARVSDLLVNYCGVADKVAREKLLQPSDVWLTAEEAVKLKLADSVFTKIL
jgi:ATP-dependent protease ClpP protease subunit